jgi:holo-[acyl-carrier protein] synthase
MIIGIGTDLVQIARKRGVIERQGERFVTRILTPAEQQIFNKKNDGARYLAKRFAAKEAASKALGTGIGKVSWQDMEITNDSLGAPMMSMAGNAKQLLNVKGNVKIHLSITDEQDYVNAFVLLENISD